MDILKLPKIELHCHLDGSMPVDIIRELSGEPSLSPEQLQAKDDCGSLAEYLEKFDIPVSCLQTEQGLKRAGYGLLQEVAKENMKYIEVRFAPAFSTTRGLSLRTVIESLSAGLKEGFRDFGVHASIIVCAMRHMSMEDNMEVLKAGRELLGEGVCAFDLAGDEAAWPTSGYRDLFHAAARLDMPYTIHSGECGSLSNVREAFELGAKRIGHGISLREDEDLMRQFAEKRIGIEMCPISNLQTKAIRRWADYPLPMFLEKGLKVSINTDNRTVSNTSMTRELQLVYDSYGQDEGMIYQLLENAVETSFADDSLKHELLKVIEKGSRQ